MAYDTLSVPSTGTEPRSIQPAAPDRLISLDAFRGLTMIWMISEGFGLSAFRDHPILGPVAAQFRHTDWQGMTAWDLIQPFFMFIVGVAMPYSFARRWERGETWTQSLRHVLWRCSLLILLGLIARSIQAGKPTLDLINVLAQVSVTYLIAFLVLRKSWMTQGIVALGLLVLHWAIYQFSSAPGVLGPWVKDANIGWYLDRLILHKNWNGSYATINCISSAANTVFGVMAGVLLRSNMPSGRKMRILGATGVAGIAAGLALSPWIPIIKKIWTPSFALYSAGFTLLALLAFYAICDVMGYRRWTKLFVIVGSNSIFIYVFHETLNRWLHSSSKTFVDWTQPFVGPWSDVLTACLAIAFQIYVCYWLWKKRIFFKV